jgi:hypothetical protein
MISHHYPLPRPRANNCATADPSTGTSTQPRKAPVDEPNTQGVSKADKIRYGQSIQEGGMGGKTTSSTGEANAEGTLWELRSRSTAQELTFDRWIWRHKGIGREG